MASVGLDYSVTAASVLNFNALAEAELAPILGSVLLNAVGAAAGAAGSVFVLRGILGKDVIGRFEQLVGVIGGTVIGFSAGCIVFSFSGFVSLGFVAAFILGALAGGVICAVTAFRKQIFSAIHNLWTTIMDKIRGFSKVKAVLEAVESALSKVSDSMFTAYNSIGTMLDRLKEAMKSMDHKQKEKVLEGLATSVKKFEATIDQATEGFVNDLPRILAGAGVLGDIISEVMREINQIKEENSRILNSTIQDLNTTGTLTP